MPAKSERQQHVHHLLAVARLLDVGDLAAPAIGDAGLRDLAAIDGVVALDVLRPHDAGDDQFADFEIDPYLLLAFDHQVAVRQKLRDDGGDVGLQRLLAVDRTLAVAGCGRARGQEVARQHLGRGGAERLGAGEVGDGGILTAGAAALGLVGDVGLVGDIDGHRQDVADPRRALVLEERPGAVPPQRIGVVGRGLRFRHRHLHRLVTGLRGRIFDLRQLRLFTDLRQPVDRRAAARDGSGRQQGADENDAVETGLELEPEPGHEHYSAFGATCWATCDVLTAATATGTAVSRGLSEEVVSAAAGSRGVGTEIETWPRPTTTPDTVRLDCRLSTLTTSPSVPPSSALP